MSAAGARLREERREERPDRAPERPRKHAIVLSGGAANGAYEVGLLKALAAGRSMSTGYRPLEPEVFTGTSIGAFNATFLLSLWEDLGTSAVSNLETVWLDRLAERNFRNGGYRIRANPFDAFNPAWYIPNPLPAALDLARDSAYLGWEGLQRAVHLLTNTEEPLEQRVAELFDLASFVSRQPWKRTIEESIPFANIRRSPRQLRVAATNWTTGKLRVFDNRDMTDVRGPEILMASSALPGIFEPVAVGAEPFVDGGVLMNTPLNPAIQAGADVLHVVYLDPDVSRIPFSTLRNTVGATYRMQTISWARVVNNDIEDAEAVNRAVELALGIGRGEDVTEEALDAVFKAGPQIARALRRASGHLDRLKLLTIHRYNPSDEFEGGPLGLLNLQPDRLARLIERGFSDGAYHDCEACGCVIPGGYGATSDPVADLEALRSGREAREAESPGAAP